MFFKTLDRLECTGNGILCPHGLYLFLSFILPDLPRGRKPIDWNTRMKIAAGAARGLEYLHNKMKPPVIYRDLKCSNILLGEGYHSKLSDFGLAKVGSSGL